MNTRNRIMILIGLLVSVVFIVIAFQDLQPQQFIDSIRSANPFIIIAAALLYFVAVTVIALRWQFLLRAIKLIPLAALVRLTCIGYMGNNVYPLRAGEALRVYLLRRNHEVPIAKSATTVVIERVFDGLVMLSFVGLALLVVDLQLDEIRQVATFAAPIFFTAMVVFFILATQPNIFRRLVKFFANLLPSAIGEKLVGFAEEIIAGLEGLRTLRHLLGAIIASFATWSIEAVVYWLVMIAFGFDLGYPVALLVVGIANLAGLVPASPGMLGVYEFFVTLVLVGVGIARSEATAYAIVVHIVIWLPVTVVGFIFLVRQGLGWSTIQSANQLETSIAT